MVEPHTEGQSTLDALFPRYISGKRLGGGTFAEVILAKHTLTGNEVAVKILDLLMLEDKDLERVKREIQILRSLSHPHIVRLFEVIEKDSKIYLVMEYMEGKELFYYIVERGRLPEDEGRYFFQQIISGVEFCHLNMVAHRDLKPENILMDSKGNVKLADFGLSNVMRDGHLLKTSCGSPNYAAPEIFIGKHYCGPEIDVWSCGVILYVLLCGRPPFDAELPFLFKTIKEGHYTFPSYISPGAMDLIRRILVVDPMTRITISGIRRHPWFGIHLPCHLFVPAEEIRKRVNEETVTYYLLMDKRARSCTAQLNGGLNERSDCGTSNVNRRENTYITTGDSPHEQSYQRDTRISPRLQHSVRRNWALGLQSFSRPTEIMREVLTVFQRLNICWKKI